MQCGPPMKSCWIFNGNSIPFIVLCYKEISISKKCIDLQKDIYLQKRIWISEDVIDGPHCSAMWFFFACWPEIIQSEFFLSYFCMHDRTKNPIVRPSIFYILWNIFMSITQTVNVIFQLLEPVRCKKRQKIVPDQLLVWGIRALWRFWMVPNWS